MIIPAGINQLLARRLKRVVIRRIAGAKLQRRILILKAEAGRSQHLVGMKELIINHR